MTCHPQRTRLLDLDESGTIEENELKIGLSSIGCRPTQEELHGMMDQVPRSLARFLLQTTVYSPLFVLSLSLCLLHGMMDQVDNDYSGVIELSEFVMFMVIFKRDHAHKAPDHGPNGAVVPRTKDGGAAEGVSLGLGKASAAAETMTKDAADEEVAAFDDEKQMKQEQEQEQGGGGGSGSVDLVDLDAPSAEA